jgi:PAS domain S-box-containing protein
MPHFTPRFRASIAKWTTLMIGALWKQSPFQHQDPTADGLAFWRERIVFSVLATGTFLSIIALLPALYMALSEGLWLLVVVDLGAVIANTFLLMRRGIDLRIKAAGVLMIIFTVGVAVISQAGFLSGGASWLFCFAVLAGVLLGLRAALIATVLNAVALVLLWWLLSPGYGGGPTESVSALRSFTAWANFLFLNAGASISVAVLVNGLQALNQKTTAATKALEDERAHLLQVREKLKEEIVVRIESEKALHKSEQQYRLLAENIHDVIWMMDMDFRVTYVSPSIERLQGWTPSEYQTLKFQDVVTPASLNRALDEFSRQCDLGRQSGSFNRSCVLELELLRKSGSPIWAEVTASFLLGEDGHPIGMLGMAHDISARRRAEKEKQALQESLARSKKMEALGTLAGGVAHDLNNVLSGVVSYPDLLLLDMPADSPIREPIEVIRESGKKAAAIVEDLLTLARRGVHTDAILNLNDLIEEYLVSPEFQRLQSFHPLVDVETRLDPELLNIMGSPIHLSKTIMNLVSNSAEAISGSGKITITTQNRYLDRYSQRKKVPEGDYTVLTVSDSGVGIPTEDLQRIFEPFFTKKKMGRSGTGLGMAVVWGTVEDHHGYIDVQSAEGAGTHITVWFPATRKESVSQMPSNSLDDYKGAGETLLVVDDSKEQRQIATKIIEQLGYVAKSVESGERAIALLEQESADLLILDMIMAPGIDGFETYCRVKKMYPHQKAIVTSGYAETERVKMAKRMGVGGYLKKPYTVHNLACAIKAELNRT